MTGMTSIPCLWSYYEPTDLSNYRTLSVFVGLASFIEQQALWEQISSPSTVVLSNPGVVWDALGTRTSYEVSDREC